MGDASGATCPSFEQLTGVVDVSDPCQSGGPVAISNPGTCYNTFGSTVPCPASGQTMTTTPAGTGPFAAPGAASSLSSMFSQFQIWVEANPLMAGGIAAGVFLLFALGGRRR